MTQIIQTPVISLWMPWANWVALGWKTIETRMHRRLAGLVGKRIGIHAALRWDDQALREAAPFLEYEQQQQSERFLRLGGAIICTVYVSEFRPLTAADSPDALIDCGSIQRYGLILTRRRSIEAIPAKGKQGIWYAEIGE